MSYGSEPPSSKPTRRNGRLVYLSSNPVTPPFVPVPRDSSPPPLPLPFPPVLEIRLLLRYSGALERRTVKERLFRSMRIEGVGASG